jgi:hypothetical protein
MATRVREHLTALHDRMVEHHTKKAASHAARATHFTKLATQLGKTETTEAVQDSAAVLGALAGLHEEMSQEHTDMATFHADSKEACQKAASDQLDKVVPTNISGIAPPAPTIRPIPRTGSPAFPATAAGGDEFLKTIIGTAEDHTEELSLQK